MEPISWQKAKYYIETNQLHLLARNEDQHKIYIKEMDLVKQKYKSIGDHIYHNILHYDVINENNKLVAVCKNSNKEKLMVLVLNNYPYYFESNITQYVLWSITQIDENNIKSILEEKLPYILNKPFVKHNYDYMYWINPIQLKSVENIWHCHVIIKN